MQLIKEKWSWFEYVPILEKNKLELSFSVMGTLNAPIYRSHAANESETRTAIQSVLWPAHSPDLNSIENFWAFMKTQLWNYNLEFPDLDF